jgi:NAD-dependent deacetylase
VNAAELDAAVEILRNTRLLVASTGAGMSRESGIPTFRDAQEGLWASFDPEELATEAGFRAAPARVWSWYAYRRARILACEPHAGHRALVEFERLIPDVAVVTQNIDGLHEAAGSSRVIELHGNIRRSRCLDASHPFAGDLPTMALKEEDAEVDPPHCPECGSPLRPDVVWFGELLPADATQTAWALAQTCDTMLVVGTSGMVWPAAELPFVAARAGARIIEVNPTRSEITRVADVFIAARAGEALPELVRRLRGAAP